MRFHLNTIFLTLERLHFNFIDRVVVGNTILILSTGNGAVCSSLEREGIALKC